MSLDRSKKYASDSNKDIDSFFPWLPLIGMLKAVLDSGINDIFCTSYHYIMKRERLSFRIVLTEFIYDR
jgi:hypothetical protein